jgi:hypothetical protein
METSKVKIIYILMILLAHGTQLFVLKNVEHATEVFSNTASQTNPKMPLAPQSKLRLRVSNPLSKPCWNPTPLVNK